MGCVIQALFRCSLWDTVPKAQYPFLKVILTVGFWESIAVDILP